jgi:anti-sigma B factor antagonist
MRPERPDFEPVSGSACNRAAAALGFVVPLLLELGMEVAMGLNLQARKAGDVTVVTCSGRIVFGEEAAELRETIKSLLKQTPKIVLDLKNVSYIDSGGLGTLVGLYTSARSAGGELKLSNLTHRVHDQLQITKLITVFDCYDSEAAAIASFEEKRLSA